LVQGKLAARVDLRLLSFKYHLHDAEIHVARVAKQFIEEVLVVNEHIDIISMALY
jgi:hypothetical protein